MFEKATKVQFKNVEDLATVWCEMQRWSSDMSESPDHISPLSPSVSTGLNRD